MRTILNAICEDSACAEQSKDGTHVLRGVAVQWVDIPESDSLPERAIRCSATDGKALAVVFVDPGKGWPSHEEPIIIHADGIKAIKQLLKRVEKILDDRPDERPVVGVIETWCQAIDEDGNKINPFQVLRIDVPRAGDGIVVSLVGGTPPPNIDGVMTPRRLRMGTPGGMLFTEYVVAAQEAVGCFGAPLWYTDGRMAILFNRSVPERAHDFAIVMPVVRGEDEAELYPWGKPEGGVADTDALPAPGGDLVELADEIGEDLPPLPLQEPDDF